VLTALTWPNHVHHARAVAWFARVREEGWATCPLTEAGFVRVSSNARAIPGARAPSEAIDVLRQLRALSKHSFWTDDVSPIDEDAHPFTRVHGYRQITDAHLLMLALRRSGRLATFDRELAHLTPDQETAVELIP
jgi:toxin-antitoxin system PIN domain toxin